MIRRLSDPSLLALRDAVADDSTAPEDLRNAVYQLSTSLASAIADDFAADPADSWALGLPTHPQWGVITTKNDSSTLGKGLTDTLHDCVTGFMDFGTLHGAELLRSPVRELCIPAGSNTHISTLVVGKAILATGCTAVTLAKSALTHFMPAHMAIASIYYSAQGLREVATTFPAANIYVVGDPDFLDNKWINALA